MYCNQCGAKTEDNVRFCPKCGARLAGDGQSVSTETFQRQTPKWESATAQVAPVDEDEVVKIYETFCWELVSSQTVDTKDSHLENRFGTIYSVTESKNYVKLVFRRDKNMPNYKRIAELEEEYILSTPPDQPKSPGLVVPIIGTICILLALALTPSFLIWAGICAVIYLVKRMKYQKKNAEYLKEKEDADVRRMRCLEAMQELGLE